VRSRGRVKEIKGGAQTTFKLGSVLFIGEIDLRQRGLIVIIAT